MSSQLNLNFGNPLPLANKAVPDWKKQQLRPHGRFDARYNPRQIRRIVLQALDVVSWSSFADLCDLCEEKAGQHAGQVSHVLDFLKAKERIECTRLYIFPGSLLALKSDRTIAPQEHEEYLGFELGYRRKSSTGRSE